MTNTTAPRPLHCTQCGEQRFFMLPAPEVSHANVGAEALEVMLGGLRAMMSHGWTDTYVCRHCGTVIVRVRDLVGFSRVAGNPASNMREVIGASSPHLLKPSSS